MPRKKKEVLKTCGKIETQFPAHVTQTEIAISKLKDAELIDPKQSRIMQQNCVNVGKELD